MHDDEQIAGHPYRPEIPVAGRVQFVELESGISRIQLQIECSGLGSLLLLACKPRQAIDKRIRNPKIHLASCGAGPWPAAASQAALLSYDAKARRPPARSAGVSETLLWIPLRRFGQDFWDRGSIQPAMPLSGVIT